MIEMRFEVKPAFYVTGTSVRISGQNNDQFANFWAQCHENGITEILRKASDDPAHNITGSRILGVSRVETDPANRAFDFYVASECKDLEGYDTFRISGGQWAVFTGDGNDPMALIRAEMEAFMNWLPHSEYEHDHRPELEVYPERDDVYVEFWLPIK